MTATKLKATKSTAITAPATEPSVIARIKSHQATQLTAQAFIKTADGFKAVWAMESENHFGQSVALFLKDIFVACLLPLLSLLWLGLRTAYQIASKPETRAAISSRWNQLTDWLSPKFDY